MIDSTFSLYQVLGAVALAVIGTGVFPMITRFVFSRQERGVAIDSKVSDGWKRYAEKLEKQLDLRERQCSEENARKDAYIVECEEAIRKLNHELRNAETTVRITSDVKALETQTAKEELHHAVDESIGKMTP